MKEIQEEAKRRFPIGCYFIRPDEGKMVRKLLKNSTTYQISGNHYIYADEGNGSLWIEGKWATLVDKDGNPIPETVNYEIY